MRFVILLLFLLCSSFPYSLTARSDSNPDSLRKVWNSKTAPDSSRLKAMGRLIQDYYVVSKPDSALILSDLQNELAVKLKDEKIQSDILHTRARIAANSGEVKKALGLYEQCLACKKRIGDEEGVAACMNNMGKIYIDYGLFEKAFSYFFQSLRIREKRKDQKGMINVLGNIGNAYSMQENQVMAIGYITKSLGLCRKYGNTRGTMMGMISLGVAYMKLNNVPRSLSCSWEARALVISLNDEPNLARVLHNLGTAHNHVKNFDSASYYLNASLELRIKLNDTVGIGRTLYGLAEVAADRKQYREAIRLGEASDAILKNTQNVREKLQTLRLLYVCHELVGNYEKALAYHKRYADLNGKGANDNVKNALFREQLKYDLDKKAEDQKTAHLLAMTRLNLAREQEASRQHTWMLLLAALCVLVAVTGYFMYSRTRQRKIIADQKANLLKQQLLVSQLNPHFIFNSLNAVQQYIFSQNSHEAGIYLGRFSELMRMILDFSREDFIPVESELHFIKEYLELQQLRFPQRFRYEIITDPAIDHTALQLPPMIAQPFIENAVEHGISRDAANGLITVRLFFENNLLHYEIEDNGIGLEAASQQERKSKHRSLATVIVRERLDALQQGRQQYTVTVTDKATAGGKGVLVHITVPFIR